MSVPAVTGAVFADLVRTAPAWLLAGILLAAVFGFAVLGIMLAGRRLFPPAPTASRSDSADDRRRAEIRRYLDAIDEPYEENATVAGREVAFHLLERDVSITFDARAFFHIERTGSEAVLVEHEMPAAHLGGRLPFDTPDLEPGGRDESSIEAAYAVLGLPSGADDDAIERAYRERVKEANPDGGGSTEAFRRIQDAYETLSEATQSPPAT